MIYSETICNISARRYISMSAAGRRKGKVTDSYKQPESAFLLPDLVLVLYFCVVRLIIKSVMCNKEISSRHHFFSGSRVENEADGVVRK